jgi:exodeoxyribonuclease-3
LDFGNLRLINAYFPSGTTGDERQSYKYKWLEEFFDYIQDLRKTHPNLVLCGDYNFAHKEIDIHNPAGNKNTSCFLPEDRKWMDKLYSNGWVDTFRKVHPEPHRYSWWSQRFPSVRASNKGWRIDYISVTDPLNDSIKDAEIYPDVKHSDHCPVYLELEKY